MGCRTQAPEVIAGRTGEEAAKAAAAGLGPLGPLVAPLVGPVGRRIGKETVEKLKVFPPIWTRIAITMHANGACTAELKAHSLFPSVTYYESRLVPANMQPEALLWTRRSGYDGVPQYNVWLVQGWGQGNPWLVDHP